MDVLSDNWHCISTLATLVYLQVNGWLSNPTFARGIIPHFPLELLVVRFRNAIRTVDDGGCFFVCAL